MINATLGTPGLSSSPVSATTPVASSAPFNTSPPTITSTPVASPGPSFTPPTPRKSRPPLKLIIGLFVVGLTIVGSAIGFFLTQQNQDNRQQATGGWSCNGNTATGNVMTLFNNTWCDGQARWKWEAAGNSGSCGGNSSSPKSEGCGGGGGNPPPTDPNTCSPNSPTASACRNGNALGSSCTGFDGICQGTNTDASNGKKFCACVARSGSCSDGGGTCVSGNSCSTQTPPRSVANGGGLCNTNQVCCGGILAGLNCTYSNAALNNGNSICNGNNVITCNNGSIASRACPTNTTICENGDCVNTTEGNRRALICNDAAPTATSCRSRTVNASCSGFVGQCIATGIAANGYRLCACIPQTPIGDNASCTDDSNCASGFCRKTQQPFACRPASERPGSSATPGPGAGRCPNDQNLVARKYLKFTCPNGCTNTTEGGVTAWRCYENRVEGTSPLTLNGACGQVDVLSGDTDASYCGYSEYTCDEIRCHGGGSTTPPTTQPTVPPTNSPGPMCLSVGLSNVTRPNQPPIKGDAIRLTCGTVTGASGYVFRIIEPDQTLIDLQATGAISSNFIITKSGTHFAQCQFCTGTGSAQDCREFEPTTGYTGASK